MNHPNQWAFVIAAWGLTLAVSAGLSLWSWIAMRASEKSGGERK